MMRDLLTMKQTILSMIWLLLLPFTAQAQMADPVHFKSEMKMLENNEAEILFKALIDPGWHVYSTNLGSDGPVEATFNVEKMAGAECVGSLKAVGKEIKQYDEMFGMELRFFEKTVTFKQKIRFTARQYDIDCYLEYGACNDQSCMPPTQVVFREKGTVKSEELRVKSEELRAKSEELRVKSEEFATASDSDLAPRTSNLEPRTSNLEPQTDLAPRTSNLEPRTSNLAPPAAPDSLWLPVVSELQALGSNGGGMMGQSLLYILLMGFVGGLLAVCMPCIWPIIPMTVSFFLKRSKTDRRKGIRDAMTYGLSIIVIYLAMGLCVTALFGSDTLNAMSTNAVFNIFLFVLLVVFALSFFGWFELKLPESWATKVDQKSDELSSKAAAHSHLSPLTSSLSILLMAFTLVLVSFSCTAPIIGLLLVETTTSGNWLAPAAGMFGFAVALALPFTLFAMFPAWLKQAPKSGSWMNTIKVVLGFIELAFALKFFSVADLAYGWHLMDREVFLSLWIVIFALLGAYLCGWLKFQSDETSDLSSPASQPSKPMPVLCIMGGLVSLAFAVYMVPGLWGAPCKAVSAFAPPMNTQDFNLNTKTVEARFTDYEQGMAAARAEGKPVLIDFTGFGCVNCRKMEAAVWTDPRVADLLTKKFVLVSLYVDDKTPLAEPMIIKEEGGRTTEEGETKTLRTVGAKWSYLQSHKFGANAQPFYVIVDPATGKPLTGSRAYNEDIDDYIKFLQQGLSKK